VPHIIVEHTSHIKKGIDVPGLIDALHDMAVSIGSLPTGGIRTRAHETNIAHVGDGKTEGDFIYVTVRLGQGRSEHVKRDIGDKLFTVLTAFTTPYFDQGAPLSLGLEIQEIEKDWTWKKNNIHDILKGRNNG